MRTQTRSPLVAKLGAELLGTFFVTLVATCVDVLYCSGIGQELAGGFVAAFFVFALWRHAIALGASHPGRQFTFLWSSGRGERKAAVGR